MALGDGTCNPGVPCWRDLQGHGFRYEAKARAIEAIDRLTLRSGDRGRIALARKGRRLADLPMPDLQPLALPLTVQLQRDGGACFSAFFSPAGVKRSTDTIFQARSD